MIIRPLYLLASALVCLVTSVQASPITYDFGGTLAQPYKGSSLFSGSFSLESSTAGFDGAKLVSGYAGASASLSIGGQTYRFQNIMIEVHRLWKRPATNWRSPQRLVSIQSQHQRHR